MYALTSEFSERNSKSVTILWNELSCFGLTVWFFVIFEYVIGNLHISSWRLCYFTFQSKFKSRAAYLFGLSVFHNLQDKLVVLAFMFHSLQDTLLFGCYYYCLSFSTYLPQDIFYSRKNFSRPELQHGVHQNFENEVHLAAFLLIPPTLIVFFS